MSSGSIYSELIDVKRATRLVFNRRVSVPQMPAEFIGKAFAFRTTTSDYGVIENVLIV
jgi:hypothetical protein